VTNQITIDVKIWEACWTPEEAEAHLPGCLKVGTEAVGRRSFRWFCLEDCPARPGSAPGFSAARLRDMRAKIAKEEP
jgi:hypothetical protein